MISTKQVDLKLPQTNHRLEIGYESHERKEEKTSPLALLAKTCQSIGIDTNRVKTSSSSFIGNYNKQINPMKSFSPPSGQKRPNEIPYRPIEDSKKVKASSDAVGGCKNTTNSLMELIRLSKSFTPKALQESTNISNQQVVYSSERQTNNNSVSNQPKKLSIPVDSSEENNNFNDNPFSSLYYWMEGMKRVDENSQLFYQMLLNDCLDQGSTTLRPKPKFCIYCGQKFDNQFNLLIHIYSHTAQSSEDTEQQNNHASHEMISQTQTPPAVQRTEVPQSNFTNLDQNNLSQVLYYLYATYSGLNENSD